MQPPWPAVPLTLRCAGVYFLCAAGICLACLGGYLFALPRLRPALLQQHSLQAGGKGAAERPMAQPIIGYHTSSELAEASPGCC